MKNSFNKKYFIDLISELLTYKATLVAVSKNRSIELIEEIYRAGQNDFGENRVQELLKKQPSLPESIRWHQIGHLQSNKVKQIIPFVYLIHSVDSVKLLQTIEKEAMRAGKKVNVLLQAHIAQEESKFGFDLNELKDFFDTQNDKKYHHINIRGLMGMATLSNDTSQIEKEFKQLRQLYEEIQKDRPWFDTLSMGMSSDYKIALANGSNMIRIGSALFDH
ncbi:MAG TPA: YggS family pyridoxal phosphate-dependent enzyme [Bacteroidia bacterium]|nr:YggS family pyridoxal phosphate-dependent enzyme [Bacteroidia bacterium]HNT80632.1 YggS family pyridoxal phosphate-dependent enzyme [Bacteroidia bacterium]